MINPMFYEGFVSTEQIKAERQKAKLLRDSQWWRGQIGLGVCYYCQEKFDRSELTMDHVVPLSRGGRSTKKNCVVSCKPCNTKKGYKMAVELTLEGMQQFS